MTFQLTDIPRILPEILLLVLALLVLGSDIFERWTNDAATQKERARSAGSLAAIGLGMIFLITLLQSGYVYKLPDDTPINFFTNIVRNLQNGGPIGAPILGAFATDHLTMVARLTFIAAAFLTVLLALDFRPTGNPGEFYALILFSTAGMTLMAASNELILAYLAVELTSIPLYVLAGYFHNNSQSSEAGMKYFLFGALSSAILLYGMSLSYGFVANALGSSINANNLTQFPQIAKVVQQTTTDTRLLTVGMIFIIAGIGYKLAVVPFHSWSPDVYQAAPTPITAFISTASKAAGFVLLYRVLITAFPSLVGSVALGTLGGWTSLLAFVALLTLIFGNLAALPQTNAKRLLGYSSIAQAGFMLMGLVALATPAQGDRTQAVSALIYYLVIYTITNLGAFGALAAATMAIGRDEMHDLRGLARRNLGLAVLFTISVLSLAGIPPLGGFFAKFYIFMVAWQSGAEWLVIIGLFTTIISLYYYLRFLKVMFIEEPVSEEHIPLPPLIGTTLIITNLLLFVLGMFPNLVLQAISNVQVAGL